LWLIEVDPHRGGSISLRPHIAVHAFLGAEFRQGVDETFWHLFRDLLAGLDPILPPELPLPKFRRRDRAKRQLHALLQPLLAERRAHPGPAGAHNDFLQTLVEARYADGRAWTDSLILLLQHPDYLWQVRAEQDALWPPEHGIDLETLRRCVHLSWALRETERLLPSSDLLLRYNADLGIQ
jgi:sterol 14alpha-demethylase